MHCAVVDELSLLSGQEPDSSEWEMVFMTIGF